MFTTFVNVLKDIDHSLSLDHRYGWKMMSLSVGIVLGSFLWSAINLLRTL